MLGAAGFAVGWRPLWAALQAPRFPRRPTAWLLLAVCGLLLLAQSPTWFAPPVGGDQTKYHLAYPRLYAEAGRLVPTPWSFWGAQQWLQNFLFAIGYALRGEDLARLLNAASGVLAALAMAMLVRRHFDRRLGVVAGALFFTMPMWWSKMVRAGVDACLVTYTLLAVSAWLDWVRRRRPADLRRTAILAGLAGGSKVMGLLVPALIGIGILTTLVRRRVGPARFIGASLTFGLLTLALLSPWYVRNWVEVGNPTYPFGQRLFAGSNWSVEGEDVPEPLLRAVSHARSGGAGRHAVQGRRGGALSVGPDHASGVVREGTAGGVRHQSVHPGLPSRARPPAATALGGGGRGRDGRGLRHHHRRRRVGASTLRAPGCRARARRHRTGGARAHRPPPLRRRRRVHDRRQPRAGHTPAEADVAGSGARRARAA